jgi:hypothetical protein
MGVSRGQRGVVRRGVASGRQYLGAGDFLAVGNLPTCASLYTRQGQVCAARCLADWRLAGGSLDDGSGERALESAKLFLQRADVRVSAGAGRARDWPLGFGPRCMQQGECMQGRYICIHAGSKCADVVVQTGYCPVTLQRGRCARGAIVVGVAFRKRCDTCTASICVRRWASDKLTPVRQVREVWRPAAYRPVEKRNLVSKVRAG